MGNHLQVLFTPAEMVDLLGTRDEAKEVGVSHQMDCNGLPVERHATVATTTASS